MQIKNYLEKLQSTDEMDGGAVSGTSSGVSAAAGINARYDAFPSIPKDKKKKKQILRVAYPNEAVENKGHLKRVMIDVDGTIHKYSKGFGDGSMYDDPFPGARKVIDFLRKEGYEIVIFTTRASAENAKEYGQDVNEQIENVENWLSNNNIYYDRVTAEKLHADFYIDDKAIYIKNGDWLEVLKEIKIRLSH